VFDLDRIKALPILEIASVLGIDVRGSSAICFACHRPGTDRSKRVLAFNPTKNTFKCYWPGCGIHGGGIDLVMAHQNLDFRAAARWLSDRFGIPTTGPTRPPKFPTPHKRPSQPSQPLQSSQPPQPATSSRANPNVYEAFLDGLSLSDAHRGYLRGRGFDDGVIDRAGFVSLTDPDGEWLRMVTMYPASELVTAGLGKRYIRGPNQGQDALVWWDPAIILPFKAGANARIGWLQGRRMTDPKYIGLAGVPVPMFGDYTLHHLAPSSTVHIVEGAFDALSWIVSGHAAVGIVGAGGFKDAFVHQLEPFDLVVVPDRDQAGWVFARTVINTFARIGKRVLVKSLPTEFNGQAIKDSSDLLTAVRRDPHHQKPPRHVGPKQPGLSKKMQDENTAVCKHESMKE